MILRALHSSGKLDISSQETHKNGGDSLEDSVPFRLTLLPDQTVTISDRYRRLKNIEAAINAGLLEVVSYDSSADSDVAQEEVGSGTGDENDLVPGDQITLDDTEFGVIDTVSLSESVTNKWFVSVSDGTNSTVYSAEVYAQYDGTDVIFNKTSLLGSASITIDVDIVGGDMRLTATASDDDQIIAARRIAVFFTS